MTGDKSVVSLVELVAREFDFILVGVFQLCPQTLPHRVAHFNHAANAKLCLNRQMRQWNQLVAFTNGNFIIVKGVSIGFDVAGRGNGLLRCGDIQRTIERFINFCREIFDRLGQCLLDVLAITDERWLALRIHPPF